MQSYAIYGGLTKPRRDWGWRPPYSTRLSTNENLRDPHEMTCGPDLAWCYASHNATCRRIFSVFAGLNDPLATADFFNQSVLSCILWTFFLLFSAAGVGTDSS